MSLDDITPFRTDLGLSESTPFLPQEPRTIPLFTALPPKANSKQPPPQGHGLGKTGLKLRSEKQFHKSTSRMLRA